jgi:3-dehydroquinate synthase class II
VSDTSLSVRSADGYTATYVVNADTTVRKNGDKVTISDIKAGDHVRVVADKDGSTLKAFRIRTLD